MQYQILYDQSFPVIRAYLAQNEVLKAEADAMVAMSATIDVTGKVDGGILNGLARKFSGEKFFFQYLTATRGPGEVLLAQALPGGIQAYELNNTYALRIQKNGFLAATEGIDISTTIQSPLKGLFSKEGFFVVKASGTGLVFVSCFGAIHTIELAAGEERIIDNGHLVAWPDTMEYKIEKASKGIINSMTSGEFLVCRFRGPGTILIQTRNPNSFLNWTSVK
jgi:uncharacterized protein (TIGR00266 family)